MLRASSVMLLAPLLLAAVYLALVALVVVLAVLHPDPGRRGEARRVLTTLLTVWPGRRRR